jgi:hypothetical protein
MDNVYLLKKIHDLETYQLNLEERIHRLEEIIKSCQNNPFVEDKVAELEISLVKEEILDLFYKNHSQKYSTRDVRYLLNKYSMDSIEYFVSELLKEGKLIYFTIDGKGVYQYSY